MDAYKISALLSPDNMDSVEEIDKMCGSRKNIFCGRADIGRDYLIERGIDQSKIDIYGRIVDHIEREAVDFWKHNGEYWLRMDQEVCTFLVWAGRLHYIVPQVTEAAMQKFYRMLETVFQPRAHISTFGPIDPILNGYRVLAQFDLRQCDGPTRGQKRRAPCHDF